MSEFKAFSQDEIREHDTAYDEGWRLMESEIRSHGRRVFKPRWLVRRRLERAIRLFKKALEINPASWQSMWALGKAHQRLGDNAQALDWFLKARAIQPENPDVTREASISALGIGRSEQAISLTSEALAANPADPGLLSNHALALMMAGRTAEAKAAAERAVQANPHDPVSRRALRLITEVTAGRRRRPDRVPIA